MQITIMLKPDLTVDEVNYAMALGATKLENVEALKDRDYDISLHTPAKSFLGTIYIRGNE